MIILMMIYHNHDGDDTCDDDYDYHVFVSTSTHLFMLSFYFVDINLLNNLKRIDLIINELKLMYSSQKMF